MKPIAIHHRQVGFSNRWIEYCQYQQVPYIVVDCYASDIIEQLHQTSALLWHIVQGDATDMLMGRYVLNAAELMGIVVFPDWATQWHFDDKVAQKYLLESIGAPLVPSYVFFDLETALSWIDKTKFPKVFKLRRGSGSRNVQLVNSPNEAHQLARKAFREGYKPTGSILNSINVYKAAKAQREGRLWDFLRSLPGKVRHRMSLDFLMGRERGYIYFQEFMPGNDHDTRITVIGRRAFGFTRQVRPGDFRASGSGRIVYDRDAINPDCIHTAFRVAHQLKAQSMAFDFVNDASGNARIVEVSFGYASKPVFDCGGFWDPDLIWHDEPTWPEHAILEDVLTEVANIRCDS